MSTSSIGPSKVGTALPFVEFGRAAAAVLCRRRRRAGHANAAAIDTAYAAIKSKINLDNPAASRLVVRLRDEFHNCWGNAGCARQRADHARRRSLSSPTASPSPTSIRTLLISKGLTLYDGTVAAGGNRYEAATIAKYEFKTGMGNIAYDTSGLEPALNLTMSGDITWVGGWGLNVKMGGKAQGTAAGSKKLSDLIKSTGEFTIEAWANNANVAQEDAFIVSYSAGAMARNVTLAQRMYQYEGYTRSDKTGANGNPVLLTRAADMDAQAALQHVVMTYSPVEGRRFYVNGVYTGDADAQGGGSLADWDDTFALVLGNETSTNRQWEGVLRMVAIHNRALTPTQIQQNFDAGVGEKYFMLFNVSHLVPNVPQAYVMLEASQLDSYGLQFTKPTFISLDPTVTSIPNVPIEGIRIGVNGARGARRPGLCPAEADHRRGLHRRRRPADVERGYGHGARTGRARRPVLPVIRSHRRSQPTIVRRSPTPSAPAATDLPPESDVGLRTFDEINTTLSLITGVPQTNTRVRATYTLVKQALPAIEKFGAFGPAQQTALAQLAMQYCNVLVDDNTLRAAFFGGSTDRARALRCSARPAARTRRIAICSSTRSSPRRSAAGCGSTR